MLLTFEYYEIDKTLFIFCDKEGLEDLKSSVPNPTGKPDHIHLIPPHEITLQRQRKDTQLIYHVVLGRCINEQEIADQLGLDKFLIFEFIPGNEPGGGVEITCNSQGAKFLLEQLSQLNVINMNIILKTQARGGTALTDYNLTNSAIPIQTVQIFLVQSLDK